MKVSTKSFQKTISVVDHLKFCCFEYESETSTGYQLGDVLIKDYSEHFDSNEEDPKEIGVVIQTFADGDVRTDMWGMCCESEVRIATVKDIKELRPSLMEYLSIK
jgi:hypothetical protein